jgi:hypothetical protein
MASLRGAHTKRKFKYGKELSPRGRGANAPQKVERFLKGPGNREGQKGCFAVSSMREFPICRRTRLTLSLEAETG